MSVTPLLEIRNLKKTYLSPDGERILVIDVPIFVLDEGEMFAIYGSSGSGKTTFLNLISGILKPDSGSILLNQEEMTLLSESRRDKLRGAKIGYIYQSFNLLKQYSALENILLAMMLNGNYNREYAMDLMDQVELGNKYEYKPDQLSVGQHQRVAVARALANNPSLVLADEPTGNLDTARAVKATDLIRNVCQKNNASLILVSHDINILNRFESRYKFESFNKALKGY